jgi:carboxyl-terminal processing protease
VRNLGLLLAPVALVAGIWIGGHSANLPGPIRDFATDGDVAVVDSAIQQIHDDYFRGIAKKDLANQAIGGAVKGLHDPFSNYFDPSNYKRFRELTDARFSGVGMTVQKVGNGLRIVQVYDGSPAKKAGLLVGDVIVAADGQKLGGRPEQAATSLIKGRPGTQVELTILRGRRTFTRRVTRAQVVVPVVQAKSVTRHGKRVDAIRLDTFSSGAHAEVYRAVKKAVAGKASGIVLDLRGNGGGLVTEARLVASAFLADGKIVTTRGRAVPEQVYMATGHPVAPTTPLVVLVDQGTASASEIVAGALQDRHRAKLAGTKTFGKGVFQQVVELDNGGALDITVGQYFLPSGRNIGGRGVQQGAGLTPDVKAADNPHTKPDEGLDRAVAVLVP